MSKRKAAERGVRARRARATGGGAKGSLRPDFRLIAIGVLLGLFVSAFLVLLLLEPPPQGPAAAGGVSIVEKSAPVRAGEAVPQAEATPEFPPSPSQVRGWVRSQAREFVGGVDSEGMPLYRFEVWLEAPEAARERIRSVSYEYAAPSAKPPQQSSDDAQSGFRVRFAAADCAEEATVTLVLNDDREHTVDFDGCKALN